MFKQIKDLFTPYREMKTSDDFVPPYGMSDGEWRKLKEFHASDEWTVFSGVLDAIVKFNAETLLRTKDSDELQYLRGFISGIRKAGSIVREQELREIAFISEKRSRENEPRNNRSATFFGSPAWRNQSNRRNGSS